MLRWRGDESLEIYARVNNEDWASWTRKMVNVAVDSSIAPRLTYMDFSEETRQRFNDVAEAMLRFLRQRVAGVPPPPAQSPPRHAVAAPPSKNVKRELKPLLCDMCKRASAQVGKLANSSANSGTRGGQGEKQAANHRCTPHG